MAARRTQKRLDDRPKMAAWKRAPSARSSHRAVPQLPQPPSASGLASPVKHARDKQPPLGARSPRCDAVLPFTTSNEAVAGAHAPKPTGAAPTLSSGSVGARGTTHSPLLTSCR